MPSILRHRVLSGNEFAFSAHCVWAQLFNFVNLISTDALPQIVPNNCPIPEQAERVRFVSGHCAVVCIIRVPEIQKPRGSRPKLGRA